MMTENLRPDMKFGAAAAAGACVNSGLALTNRYTLEAFSKPRWFDYLLQGFGLWGRNKHASGGLLSRVVGRLKWSEEFDNLVTNEGLDFALDNLLKGSSYTAAFYVGLTDGTPTTAAGDTMASHAGWAEVTAYSESVRQTLTLGSVSSQSADNSASKASFSINANSTAIGGAFISTDDTKGGTTGTLYSVGAFTVGDKGLDSGDTLNVTVTATAATP